MKLLYLGYICSNELFDEMLKNDSGLSHARQRWEMGLFSGIENGGIIEPCDVTAMSFLPSVGVEIPEGDTIHGVDVKYFASSRSGAWAIAKSMKKMRRALARWFKETKGEERIIFTYATNPVLLFPLLSVKPHGVKVISACSEVPAFRLYDERSKIARWLKKTVFEFLHNRMSGYVFFSRHDNDVVNRHGKPWTVCEGMAEMPIERSYDKKPQKDIVFYAGGLNAEYGICDLVDAFTSLNRENTELWLCGNGNAEEYIKECIKTNPAIRYFGRVSNTETLRMEREAALLVNPRPRDMMLTKYSFPSKTLEYMSSGTPAMIRRLDGIPDEYYDYAYIIEGDGKEGIEASLRIFFDEPEEKRYQKGKDAREFVRVNKTPLPQSKKILAFLKAESVSDGKK